MAATLAPAGARLQKQGSLVHDPVHPLAVGDRQPLARQFPVHQRRDAEVPIGRPLVDEAADERQQILVVGLAVGAAWPDSSAASVREVGT